LLWKESVRCSGRVLKKNRAYFALNLGARLSVGATINFAFLMEPALMEVERVIKNGRKAKNRTYFVRNLGARLSAGAMINFAFLMGPVIREATDNLTYPHPAVPTVRREVR
jgi:hypothetical protein